MKILNLVLAAAFLTACANKNHEYFAYADELKLEFTQDAHTLPKLNQSFEFNEKIYLDKVFSAWDKPTQSLDDVFWAFKAYDSGKIYFGENKLRRTKAWFIAQKDNANITKFGSLNAKAIIKRETLVRLFPTKDKLFLNPKMAGEGYPFDYLQESVLSPFAPVLVSHFSKDHAWAFVKSDSVFGFVSAKDIEILTPEAAGEFRARKFGVFIQDKKSLFEENGNFAQLSRLGAIFPYSDENSTHFKYKTLMIPKNIGSKFLTLNDENAKNIVNSVIGESYGWGGENYLRDCSLFTRDFFATFGLWLPRNSQAQGKIGEIINLKNMSNDEKKNVIKKYGVPFSSLLVMKGHVALYGGMSGENVMLIHDAWGIRDKSGGRAMIGKIAITDAQIGGGAANIDDSALLLSKIYALNVIRPVNSLMAKKALELAYGVKINADEIEFDGAKMPYNTGGDDI